MVTCPDIDINAKYTPTQAAAVLNVDRRTIYRAMQSGELAFWLSKTVKKRYIRGAQLLRYYTRH